MREIGQQSRNLWIALDRMPMKSALFDNPQDIRPAMPTGQRSTRVAEVRQVTRDDLPWPQASSPARFTLPAIGVIEHALNMGLVVGQVTREAAAGRGNVPPDRNAPLRGVPARIDPLRAIGPQPTFCCVR